jgi:xanthosine phosphorylase
MGPGSLMAVTDHISFIPGNPLIGPNDDEYGPRFPSLENAYDADLRALLQRAAKRLNQKLYEGVYAGCLGPSFETPAEIRAYANLGGDAVGMSTVPEAIVARHCGLRVAAVSVITNLAAGLGSDELSHEQTLTEANRAADRLTALVIAFLEEYARGQAARR